MIGELDHTTATCADGMAFMAWLDGTCRIARPPLSPTMRRRLERWRRGTQASFGLVDEVLNHFDLDVSQVPAPVWIEYDNGRRGHGRCPRGRP
jgi:hypothetical protein